MIISLSKDGCKKNNIDIGEVLFLLAIHNNVNFELVQRKLIEKGYITANRDTLFQTIGWRLTRKGSEIIDSVILDSTKESVPIDKLNELAKELKEIFPKGKKDGTNYYWTEGVALIVKRLRMFSKKYGDTYSNEQIINATRKYVQSFNGNYTYMKLLKYFILKEKINVGGEIESESDLVTYIENSNQDENIRNDWTTTLK